MSHDPLIALIQSGARTLLDSWGADLALRDESNKTRFRRERKQTLCRSLPEGDPEAEPAARHRGSREMNDPYRLAAQSTRGSDYRERSQQWRPRSSSRFHAERGRSERFQIQT